jgi:hypothetical protein
MPEKSSKQPKKSIENPSVSANVRVEHQGSASYHTPERAQELVYAKIGFNLPDKEGDGSKMPSKDKKGVPLAPKKK